MILSQLISAVSDPYVVIRFLHLVGAIVAVGAVTVTDSMLFLLHFKEKFAPVLDKISAILSLVTWAGLFILSTTGIYLISQDPGIVNGWIFQTKMLLVSVIFLNGIVLNEKINPRFHEIFRDWNSGNGEVTHFERFAGVFAAISVIGWWSIILLVYLKPYL
jgi:hypothetical protein